MKKLFSTLLLALIAIMANAQVTWSYKLVDDNTENPKIQMTATIADGFHLYAVENPAGGSNPLEFYFDVKGAQLVGKPVANKAYTKEFDDTFEVDQYYYANSVTFTQKLKATAAEYSVNVEIKGQACDDQGCHQIFGSKKFTGKAPVKGEVEEVETTEEAAVDTAATALTDSVAAALPTPAATEGKDGWWRNVEEELRTLANEPDESNASMLYIFIAGFVGGLIALVTPCVWPMIPMTVSFFLKQNKSRSKSIRTAIIYGTSIIVIYVALGLIVTSIFGASALNDLSTSALFNIIFFLLLVLFGVSFLGGFELTLPASWTNKMDSKVDSTTGLLSVFFMAFTLVLVSFSCTGPIVGSVIISSTSGGVWMPIITMAAFAIAFALPFTVLAWFPSLLKNLPKSGGWLNSVKVVLGFVELALGLKFLSVADQTYHWGLLDREVYLAIWIVVFTLLGFYLLGKIRFAHDSEVTHIGVGRLTLAIAVFSFVVYLIPGMWGAPLSKLSGYLPPQSTIDFDLSQIKSAPVQSNTSSTSGVKYGDVLHLPHGLEGFFDLEQAEAYAAKVGKPIFIDLEKGEIVIE